MLYFLIVITTLLLIISSLASVLLALRTAQIARRYNFTASQAVEPGLPTVTVCIAARNETHALAQCLERVLKSNYTKLEILVLDDSSSDDTSLIIKSFASGGVRFIAGTPLPTGWLGKNHAYRTLIDEASGDLILFLDVDTTIRTKTISLLVDKMRTLNLSMLSVLPKRTDIEHPSATFNTLRYHWELLLGTKKSPPSASALWMAKTEILKDNEAGFSQYGISIRPERHLARQLQRGGSYRYFIATDALGVGFEKRIKSQWETALRLYYPMAKRLTVRWVLFMILVSALLLPFFILISPVAYPSNSDWALLLVILNGLSLTVIFKKLHSPNIWRLRLIVWPLLIIQEIFLMSLSFVKYKSNTVTWKGRHINAQPMTHEHIRIDE